MMKHFKIKKNNHYSFHWPKIYWGTKTEFDIDVTLGIGCKYDFSSPDYFDINKLFGFSFGNHHKNSIRIGWRYTDEKRFMLYYYAYNDGVRIDKFLGFCNQFEKVNIKIKLNFDKNTVDITSKNIIALTQKAVITRQTNFKFPKFKIGYYLFPYFGGNRKAPQDMLIGVDIK